MDNGSKFILHQALGAFCYRNYASRQGNNDPPIHFVEGTHPIARYRRKSSHFMSRCFSIEVPLLIF